MASPVRCTHLGLACRAGLCRCRAAESVKGAARVQDSRLESGSRGVCCEGFDREHTPGPTCWAVNFCAALRHRRLRRRAARSGAIRPPRACQRLAAHRRSRSARTECTWAATRHFSCATQQVCLAQLAPRSQSPARVLECAQHPFVVRHPQLVLSNSLVDACSAPHTAPRLRSSTTSPVSSLRRPDGSCRLLSR